MTDESSRLESILGGLELRNGLLVPIDWSAATAYSNAPAPDITIDHVRLATLELENIGLREEIRRLESVNAKLREALTRTLAKVDAALGCDAAGESE